MEDGDRVPTHPKLVANSIRNMNRSRSHTRTRRCSFSIGRRKDKGRINDEKDKGELWEAGS